MRFIYSGLCVAVCAVAVDCAGEYVHDLTPAAALADHLARLRASVSTRGCRYPIRLIDPSTVADLLNVPGCVN